MTFITVLNSFEEEEALRRMKKNARLNCDEKIKAFAKCTEKEYFSIVWKCKKANKEMNDCLSNFSTEENLDHYREQLLKEKNARLKEIGLSRAAVIN